MTAVACLRVFARRRPVLAYYTLVFTISWGGILLLAAPGEIPGKPEDVDRLFLFALAALFAGPSVSGVVMTALVAGRAGLRDMLGRMVRWRVGRRWWATALLTGPVLVVAVLLGLSLYSPDFTPGLLTTEDPVGLLILGIGAGLIGGGLLEELGWTGFAVPALRQRYGVLETGLIVGMLWGAWHLLIAVWASRGMAGEASLGGFMAGFLAFYFVALPAYRVLLVWLHDHTASLLLVMLMHAVLSASTVILAPLAPHGHFTWNFVLGVLLWGVVAGIAVVRRGALSVRPIPPAAAGWAEKERSSMRDIAYTRHVGPDVLRFEAVTDPAAGGGFGFGDPYARAFARVPPPETFDIKECRDEGKCS